MKLKPLLLGLSRAANMQRWNDTSRPVELRELDKQAHKLVLSYFLGRFEEEESPGFDWVFLVEGAVFEFLQRLVLTDLKPFVFDRIKKDKKTYRRLVEWTSEQVAPILLPLGHGLFEKYGKYFAKPASAPERRVLEAAHALSTLWEFEIIEGANSKGYGIEEIGRQLRAELEGYYDLAGMRLLSEYRRYRDFVDLTGCLRFQVRWSTLQREPRTSVLGHMFIVAVTVFILSGSIEAGPKRRYNDCFTGLFHDLPEALTRDIINPVKTSVERMEELIKTVEAEEMERKIYGPGLIPAAWQDEMRMFTENEFADVATIDGKRRALEPGALEGAYAADEYDPRDGRLVKAVDALAAFVEAYLGAANNPANDELTDAREKTYLEYRDCVIAGMDIGAIFNEFV